MSDIKRYDVSNRMSNEFDEMECDDGKYVRATDHAAAMQAKDATIEQLQARIAELEERISDLEVSLDAERDLSGTYRS